MKWLVLLKNSMKTNNEMNNEQQGLLDKAYENYLKGGNIKWLKQIKVETPSGTILATIPYDKEELKEEM